MSHVQIGNTAVDPETGEIVGPGGRDRLTQQQRLLFLALYENVGRVVSRQKITDRFWGDKDEGPADNVAKVVTCVVRRKLKRIGSDVMIKTLYGYGYTIEADVTNVSVTFTPYQMAAFRHVLSLAERLDARVVETVRQAL